MTGQRKSLIRVDLSQIDDFYEAKSQQNAQKNVSLVSQQTCTSPSPLLLPQAYYLYLS